MHKRIFFVSVVALVAMVGCANSQYQTVQTGPDRYTVSGPDPNILQSNAYRACSDVGKGYTDYSVVDSNKTSMTVRCEKEPKSFFTSAGEAFDAAKKRVDAWRQQNTSDNKHDE